MAQKEIIVAWSDRFEIKKDNLSKDETYKYSKLECLKIAKKYCCKLNLWRNSNESLKIETTI